MKATNRKFAVSVLTLAVQGALAAIIAMPFAAMAEGDEDAAALINPASSIEIGAGATSQSSAKFGEYNGLNEKGAETILNFKVRGGDAYGRQEGVKSVVITGTDVGSTSRELGVEIGSQGSWNLGISSDLLRRSIADDYQTPYLGSAGTNSLVLPSGFGQVAAPNTPSAAQMATFHTQPVYTERNNTSLKAGYNIDANWGLTFDYNRLVQTGSKLISSASEGSNGAAGRVPLSALNGVAWNAENMAILMNPTHSNTDTFNLALNWTGDKGYFTGAYYGSLYHDDYNGLTWESPFTAAAPTANITNTMGTPPSNMFHQINLKGGYAFSSDTRIKGGFSRAHNTQNVDYRGSFTPAFYTWGSGGPMSLDGKVDMTHADLSLSHRVSNDLNLNAGIIYNDRDNTTASNAYTFNYLNGTATTAYNAPMSYKHTQFDLGADYRIDSRQHVRVAYGYDEMKRSCNDANANANSVNTSAVTCAQVAKETENKLGLDYKLSASDDVTMKLGYSYGKRKSDTNGINAANTSSSNVTLYNVGFYNPMQAIAMGGSSPGYEVAGFLAYFQASRTENELKANINWQAAPKLNVEVGGKYQKDSYDSTYGVQSGSRSSINLDSSYSYTEQSQVTAFVTQQNRKRDLLNYQARFSTSTTTGYTAGTWSNTLTDKDTTIGISAKQDGLMRGNLDMTEELTNSVGNTDYTTALGTSTYVNPVASFAVGDWPTIKSETLRFKLVGSYKVDKSSRIVAGYMYQRLKSTDYYYDSYQTGSALAVLPTNQQAPNYTVNVVTASYVYIF